MTFLRLYHVKLQQLKGVGKFRTCVIPGGNGTGRCISESWSQRVLVDKHGGGRSGCGESRDSRSEEEGQGNEAQRDAGQVESQSKYQLG